MLPLTLGDTHANIEQKNCSKSFYYDATSGLCKPTCDVDRGTLGDDLIYVFIPIGMMGYSVAFLAACFNHKIMYAFKGFYCVFIGRYPSHLKHTCRFRFPSILLIYWLAAALVYDSGRLVQCCASDDYFENGDNPGVLCIAQGRFLNPALNICIGCYYSVDLILYFVACLLILFPLFHTMVLFTKVWFPVRSKNYLATYHHRIHFGIALLSLILPWIGVGAIAATTSESEASYTFLPLYGCCGLISSLLGLIVWKLVKHGTPDDTVSSCNYLHIYIQAL